MAFSESHIGTKRPSKFCGHIKKNPDENTPSASDCAELKEVTELLDTPESDPLAVREKEYVLNVIHA